MLAGSYQGSLGRYRQNTISAQGAGMRTAALHSALGRTGFSGLGDICSDGWGALIGATVEGIGGAFSAYGGQEVTRDGKRQQNDAGFAAVGQGMSTAADSFESACAARRQSQANAQNTQQFEQRFGSGAGATTPPPPPAESKGIDTTTLIVIGAVALGAFVLLRK